MLGVTVTDQAARRIADILKSEAPGAMFRVSVEGGGCSGFQYKFTIDHTKAEDDVVLGEAGSAVLIDPMSLRYMTGASIDYVDELIGAAFKIRNPLATASCGCGTSFSL